MQLKKNQRGQVLVFYALMMPLIILFVGVGMDLGWYYLNVSRLQNAADAAARAGAISIVDDESNAFENYFSYLLAQNDLPADFDDYENIDKKNLGTLIHYHKEENINDLLLRSRNSAENYTRLNLLDSETDFAESADLAETTSSSGSWKSLSTNNEWTFSTTAGDKNVTGNIALKYKLIDGKNDVYGTLYYVVELREKIPHFFMPGWFDKMDAEVRAVALLQPHDKDLLTIFQELERTKVIANWEYQNKFKGNPEFYGGKWNHYQAGQGSNKKVGIKYISGDTYRTESITVATTYENSTANRTSANGGTFYSANEVDSINLDFRAETIKKFTSDWDLGQNITGQTYEFTEGWSATDGADKRILFNAEFNEAFPTRDSSLFADILWVRIESDPIKPLNYIGKPGHTNYNSVRQITLNFNADNTATSSDNHYNQRPYVIFYTGPENIDYKRDENGVLLRHSQPVVINLNADTNAIVYMPESPVIINGNNNKLTGFVIAKCFLSAVTSEDMKNGFTLYDGFNAPSKFNGGYIEVSNTDARTLYILSQDILNHNDILALNEGAQEVDTGNGLVSFYEEMQAPQYIFVNYTKDDHNQYLVTEDNKVNENKTFAAYINATYKEKFKAFSGLTDSQISAVSFPDENYNETTATYYVATSDLSDTQKDDSYVKVMVGNATKYVEKNKLPYVKVRTNNEYFYVCVYDLKLTSSGGKGVRMIDNNFTDEEITNSLKVNNKESVADVFVNPNNQYGDSWAINRTWYNANYKNWKKDKLTFSEKNGITYFMLNTEIAEAAEKQKLLNRYRKITIANEIQYINEDNNYYMKVENNQDENGNNRNDNYIIVDKNGNILTKPITAPEVIKTKLVTRDNEVDEEVFDVNTVASNDALKNKATSLIVPDSDKALSDYWNTYTREPKDPEEIPGDIGQVINGRYVGLSQNRLNKDYRVPCLERVYKNTTFNLDSDSCYSYFQIPKLKLVNYLYLNVNELKHTVNGVASDNWKVDDMFFTKIRAGWID